MKKILAAAAVVAAMAFPMALPATAQECTEEMAENLVLELIAMIEEKGTTDEQMEVYVAEVEAHYGGEPSAEDTCDAIIMLKDKVAAN